MDLKLRRRKEKIENERKEEGVREREREREGVIEREKERENNVGEWRGDDCV